jgi:hypothetical protein
MYHDSIGVARGGINIVPWIRRYHLHGAGHTLHRYLSGLVVNGDGMDLDLEVRRRLVEGSMSRRRNDTGYAGQM